LVIINVDVEPWAPGLSRLGTRGRKVTCSGMISRKGSELTEVPVRLTATSDENPVPALTEIFSTVL
jgi:hypothetical protein